VFVDVHDIQKILVAIKFQLQCTAITAHAVRRSRHHRLKL